jgi:tRNA pseudouridine38-40 synthase
MQEASNYLIGTHDFSSFRAVGCQAISPIKSIDAISVNQINEEIHITLNAKSFLYNQVRIIAGTLYNFGRNKLLPIEMEGIIRSRDRRLAGETAPGHGLYLEKSEYLN